jgi:predicted alpha/beta superfamily hydrolase
MQPPPRVHHFLRSRHPVAGRAVRVWLPEEAAAQPERRFPVLYLQDGQNVFDGDTAFAGVGWQTHATAQRLSQRKRIEPLILVGIDNTRHRLDDYTPDAFGGRGGHAAVYLEMLLGEIKPWVDAHYPTRPEAAATGIAGASLGGLFALYAAFRRPDVFSKVAAMSPAIGWAHGAILRRLAALDDKPALRVWLDAGKKESTAMRDGVKAAVALLVQKGYRKHRLSRAAELRHHEAPRARHDETAWGGRFEAVLKFLFPPSRRRRSGKPGGA